jgi:hypothetical protein
MHFNFPIIGEFCKMDESVSKLSFVCCCLPFIKHDSFEILSPLAMLLVPKFCGTIVGLPKNNYLKNKKKS